MSNPIRCLRIRLLPLALIPVAWAVSLHPQTDRAPERLDNLYSVALGASLAEMDKAWGHQKTDNTSEMGTYYRNMPVVKNPELTDALPTNFGPYRVDYLDAAGLIRRYREHNTSFPVIEIHPLHNEGARLKIMIGVSWFNYQNKHLLFGFSDWSTVEFKFDCEKQAFVISSVKLGGI